MSNDEKYTNRIYKNIEPERIKTKEIGSVRTSMLIPYFKLLSLYYSKRFNSVDINVIYQGVTAFKSYFPKTYSSGGKDTIKGVSDPSNEENRYVSTIPFIHYYLDGKDNLDFRHIVKEEIDKIDTYLNYIQSPERIMDTLSINIMSYKYLLIPCRISRSNSGHATLIIIDTEQRLITYFDSHGDSKNNTFFENIIKGMIQLMPKCEIKSCHIIEQRLLHILDLRKKDGSIINEKYDEWKQNILNETQAKIKQIEEKPPYTYFINQTTVQRNLGICGYYTLIYAYLYTFTEYTYDEIIDKMSNPDVIVIFRELLENLEPKRYMYSNRLLNPKTCSSSKSARSQLPAFDGLNLNLLSNDESLRCFFEFNKPFIIVNNDNYHRYQAENPQKFAATPHGIVELQPFINNGLCLVYNKEHQKLIDDIRNLKDVDNRDSGDIWYNIEQNLLDLKDDLTRLFEAFDEEPLDQNKNILSALSELTYIQSEIEKLKDFKFQIKAADVEMPERIYNLFSNVIHSKVRNNPSCQCFNFDNIFGLIESAKAQLINIRNNPSTALRTIKYRHIFSELYNPFILGFLMGFRGAGYSKYELFRNPLEINDVVVDNIRFIQYTDDYAYLRHSYKENKQDFTHYIGIEIAADEDINHLNEKYIIGLGPPTLTGFPFSELKDKGIDIQSLFGKNDHQEDVDLSVWFDSNYDIYGDLDDGSEKKSPELYQGKGEFDTATASIMSVSWMLDKNIIKIYIVGVIIMLCILIVFIGVFEAYKINENFPKNKCHLLISSDFDRS